MAASGDEQKSNGLTEARGAGHHRTLIETNAQPEAKVQSTRHVGREFGQIKSFLQCWCHNTPPQTLDLSLIVYLPSLLQQIATRSTDEQGIPRLPHFGICRNSGAPCVSQNVIRIFIVPNYGINRKGYWSPLFTVWRVLHFGGTLMHNIQHDPTYAVISTQVLQDSGIWGHADF